MNESFSIRQVIELTGLSEFTLRGWENRYGAFRPDRTVTGRREFLKSDIERALLLRELIKRGHKIGKIASLSTHRLQELFKSSEAEQRESRFENTLVTQALQCVSLQKWDELKKILKSLNPRSPIHLVENFFIPLLAGISASVNSGWTSIAQEHIFSSLLKEKIYSLLSSVDRKAIKPKRSNHGRFVLAAPEGDHHEIGLLLAHYLLRSHNMISLYLGPHTPAHDLAETALRFHCSHILLVSTVSKKGGARQELFSYVSEVQKKVGTHTKILMAGSQTLAVSESNSSLLSLQDFRSFDDYLMSL